MSLDEGEELFGRGLARLTDPIPAENGVRMILHHCPRTRVDGHQPRGGVGAIVLRDPLLGRRKRRQRTGCLSNLVEEGVRSSLDGADSPREADHCGKLSITDVTAAVLVQRRKDEPETDRGDRRVKQSQPQARQFGTAEIGPRIRRGQRANDFFPPKLALWPAQRLGHVTTQREHHR